MGSAASSYMPRQKQRGRPVVLDAQGKASVLQPLPLNMSKEGKSEAWLQKLVHSYPSLLSVDTIEPGLGALVPIAMEVPCAHGFVDNILLTREGEIVLVEAKLWENPQARREVVAQLLDYIAALQAMSYEAFEAAVLNVQKDAASLYGLVPNPLLAEPDFIDAVTRNLKRGRVLGIILGNGIREELLALTGLLQSHAGAHFTLALVQINLWADTAAGTLVAVPDTLAQTVMIERGIVIVEDGIPRIVSMPVTPAVAAGKTITSELFDEALATKDPALPARLRALLSQLAPLGVVTEQKASLHLLAQVPGYDAPLKLGYIAKNGQFWTDNVAAAAPPAAAMSYLETLADIVCGSVNIEQAPYVTTNGKSAPTILALLDQRHADAFFEAIAHFISACSDAARGTNG